MLNLLTSEQMRRMDAFTISAESISSLELMERASMAFVRQFKIEVPNSDELISIYCGTGNNGGDGLAIARLLKENGYDRLSVKVFPLASTSADFTANLSRLKLTGIPVAQLREATGKLEEDAPIIVDAILGSGLNKATEGKLKLLIDQLNHLNRRVIAVDIPSGLPAEGLIGLDTSILRADLTISFHRPKINFFFPESAAATERFITIPIGLNDDQIQSLPGDWKLITEADIRSILKSRKRFSHKTTYGHALIIAGSPETMGAALLCADACLHSGAGLITACIPKTGLTALNTRSPEIMAMIRPENWFEQRLNKFTTIAAGPGLGTGSESAKLVGHILGVKSQGLVFDADALNILSANKPLLDILPELTILTPHVKEFDRMFGDHNSWWERIETARKKARQLQVIILLKNQYSFIILPAGDVLINPTGNPAMSTGGMGDVLTGMIAAFLAQGYSPSEAVIVACYIHGQAGDILRNEYGMFAIPPRYIISRLPYVIGSYC